MNGKRQMVPDKEKKMIRLFLVLMWGCLLWLSFNYYNISKTVEEQSIQIENMGLAVNEARDNSDEILTVIRRE